MTRHKTACEAKQTCVNPEPTDTDDACDFPSWSPDPEPFEWPDDGYDAFEHVADTSRFASWLWVTGERGWQTRRRLHILYQEYCFVDEVRPLTPRQLENQLQDAGIIRHRPTPVVKDGKAHRPTFYRVRAPRRLRSSTPGDPNDEP